ncbi:MAG: vitamin K epoxide reductase family protein, partial [Gemmatimonadaceae bacterium]
MSKRMIVAALALAGIFVATYLLLYKLGIIGELSCSVGSCETVNTSKWATFAGLPVAAWGVGWYVAMFGLALAGTREEVER